MTGTITLTAAMRANLLSLQNTSSQMGKTQLALSTGNKVNSALDNPVNFFAAQALNTRASALSALLDGMGQSIQSIQAANQGLTSITGLVHQLTSIANAATQDLAEATTKNVLSPTAANGGINSAGVADLTAAGTAITAGSTFTLQDGSGPAVSFTVDTVANGGTGKSLQAVANAINATSGFNATIVYGNGTNALPNGTVMTAGLAYLQVTSTDNQAITAKNVGAGNALAGFGWAGASAAYTTGGSAADQTNFTNVLAQINALASNSNYQGNNLINGTGNNMTVQVNELSTNAIVVNSVDATATGLGLTGQSVTTAANIAAATAAINAALNTLQNDATGFSNSLSMIQNRQDFTNNLINTLKDGGSQLVIADKNEEGANMLALQTQQQLGIEALSLSSQANQSVLRLFG